MGSMTEQLAGLRAGDRGAADRLMEAVYEELKSVAARLMDGERRDHTLQATALVHEAYFRLIDSGARNWENRAHFFASAAGALRRILVDHARRHHRLKRGGGHRQVEIELATLESPIDSNELLSVDSALEAFARVDPAKSRLVEMRFFAGLTVDEIAAIQKRSPSTVSREWRLARAWLRRRLEADGE